MIKRIIEKGKRRPFFRRIGLYFYKEQIVYDYYFDFSCSYTIAGEDQFDVNKLFGIGYPPGTHHSSARFGWRWNSLISKLELFAYVYDKGKRTTELLAGVNLNTKIRTTLLISDLFYEFVITQEGAMINSIKIPKTHNWFIGAKLGLYFGGNQVAPKNITIHYE